LPREPSGQSVADRVAEIAALERAGEIAENGVAVVVDGIGVRERQHAAARRGAGEIENSRHGFFPVVCNPAALTCPTYYPRLNDPGPWNPLDSALKRPPPSDPRMPPPSEPPPVIGRNASGASDQGLNGVDVVCVLAPVVLPICVPLVVPDVVPDVAP